eukprot:SAG11_NODE_33799_length_275_cov_0.863636_1_plen_33_part_10
MEDGDLFQVYPGRHTVSTDPSFHSLCIGRDSNL